MSDKEIYRLIADELEAKNIDAALWTQAKETALGDQGKTEAIYIRLRFFELVKSSNPPQKSTSLVSSTALEVIPKIDELSRMRTELANKLSSQGKHSLYSILKIHPDVSDAVVAAAISDLESKNLIDSGINPAEFKYAKDMLSDPSLREQYDRQLLGSISNNVTKPYQSNALDGIDKGYSWWESSKASAIVGVLLFVIVGYLGVHYLKERNNSEVQKIAVESQKEVLKTISNAAQMKVQADSESRAEAARLVAERQNQEMEFRRRNSDQMREEQRILQENRFQAEQQQRQYQKDQAERWQKNTAGTCRKLEDSERKAILGMC